MKNMSPQILSVDFTAPAFVTAINYKQRNFSSTVQFLEIADIHVIDHSLNQNSELVIHPKA